MAPPGTSTTAPADSQNLIISPHQIYYVFGFLMIVLFILIATCAEITIVMCYFQLCNEDYHW